MYLFRKKKDSTASPKASAASGKQATNDVADVPPPPPLDDIPPPPPADDIPAVVSSPKHSTSHSTPPPSASTAHPASPHGHGHSGSLDHGHSSSSKDVKHLSKGKPSLSVDHVGERARAPSGPKVDPEHIDFAIVPCLLRSKVAYVDANKFGDLLKPLTKHEVDEIMSTPLTLIAELKKYDIHLPPNFEKLVSDDMFWKNNKGNNRKSFVYYRSEGDDQLQVGPGRTLSSGSHDGSPNHHHSSRARQSLIAGPQMVGIAEESDPNRYKAMSRKKQAESVSNDLKDLLGTLNKMKDDGEVGETQEEE